MSPLIAQVREAGLEVKGQRIINGVANSSTLQMSLQLIALRYLDGVLVKDVLIGRIGARRAHSRIPLERSIVAQRISLPSLIPTRQMRQLREEYSGLESIETAVGPNLLMKVLPRPAMQP
jgi:hypothetical protein